MGNDIKDHIVSILVLPVNVTILIPFFLIKSTDSSSLTTSSVYLKSLAFVLLLFGLLLMISTIRLFKSIGKGTLAPWSHTQRLVTKGPYRYCRNPMITGVLSILLAEALWFNHLILLFWMLAFFTISTLYFILKEEPDLEKRFGDEYVHYKKNVPRWIPKLKPYLG